MQLASFTDMYIHQGIEPQIVTELESSYRNVLTTIVSAISDAYLGRYRVILSHDLKSHVSALRQNRNSMHALGNQSSIRWRQWDIAVAR